MGHRANYVIINKGKAIAYESQWGALSCILDLVHGPRSAQQASAAVNQTDELMDWAFAEGGYLIDHDGKTLITFGYVDVDLDDEELPPDYVEQMRPHVEAVHRGPQAFFEYISPDWKGWTLVWDERGVDAFSEHLARRGITSLKTQAPTRTDGERVVVAVPGAAKVKRPPTGQRAAKGKRSAK